MKATSIPPDNLRTDGVSAPVGAGHAPPLFSWTPQPEQSTAWIVVTGADGEQVWDSGPVSTSKAEMRYQGPALSSRSVYTWQVQLSDGDDTTGPWSAAASFETGLLKDADWSASWIARAVPKEQRQVRSLPVEETYWVEDGHTLEQPFRVFGSLKSVSVDLLYHSEPPENARLELLDSAGAVIAERPIVDWGVPADRFAHFLNPGEPYGPGNYQVRLVVERGRVGWRRGQDPVWTDDDGLSPLPVTANAKVDGGEQRGLILAIGAEVEPSANPLFRKTIILESGIARARLYAVGLGYGEFSINGSPVTEAKLEPAQTDYDQRVLYRAYDVTQLLKIGSNELSAHLGRGFWAFRGTNVWGWNLAPWSREPQLIAQLEIIDDAGNTHVVSSDDTWQTAAGPITTDIMYTGVAYQLPHEPTNSQWAVLAPAPGGSLSTTPALPITAQEPITPTSQTKATEGSVTLNFGRILSGVVRCRLKGGPGTVTFKYGEYLGADGTAFCDNVLTAEPAQVDRVVLTEPGQDLTWEPQFTYKGFRYVTVAATGEVLVEDVQAVPLSTPVASVGQFESSNEVLTWIDHATGRTFLNNLHGVPTDTPVYEKNGWTADAHLAMEAVLHHFDLRSSLIKWLDDHVDSQSADGVVPQIIPTPGWGRGLDPAWSSSMVLIPWNLYWEYGELSILKQYFEPMRRYIDVCLSKAEQGGGIWPLHSWGDWVAPHHNLPPEGPAPTATMMLAHATSRLADIAKLLGNQPVEEKYRKAWQQLVDGYNRTYFDAGRGLYGPSANSYRQTMNVLPLAFGAVPDKERDRVFGSLIRDLETRTAGHLDTGAIGTKYLLPVLANGGRSDLALKVALQETPPAWGIWRTSGDTLWETWDTNSRSHNHYFLGSISNWIREQASGVQQTGPGWSSFVFKVPEDNEITWGSFRHTTGRGDVSATWRREPDRWQASLVVPSGAEAIVLLPNHAPQSVGPGSYKYGTYD